MADHFVVTYEGVLEAHRAALMFGGGVDGIKDEALIRSAIGRPYHELEGFIPYPTAQDKAGCLLHSLLNNHGFNDGSKRTAWIVTCAFLFVEGFELDMADDYPWYDQLALMVDEGWPVEDVIDWLMQFIVGVAEPQV